MVSEKVIANSFRLVRQDIEAIKDELAFAIRRIAQVEAILLKKEIEKVNKPKTKKRKTIKKKAAKKKKPKKKKDLIWEEHLAKTRRRYPKLTLKEQLEIAGRTWKKKTKKKSSKKK